MYKVQPICQLFKKVQLAHLPIELKLMNQELFFHGSSSTFRSSKMVKVHVVFSCISLILNYKIYYYFKISKKGHLFLMLIEITFQK
jgi:hypothetical protein